MRSTTRTVAGTGAVVLTAAATCFLASGSATAASAGDATFATTNEQSNLAEISLASLATAKGKDPATLTLASTTKSDHEKAKAKLTAASAAAKLSLPSAPSAAQQAVAATLKAAPASSFDLMYAQAQVSAHEQALAGARAEQASTSDAQLKAYTVYYIGIATMHLHMAQAEVSALGGRPHAVPAGTGGAAATNSSLDPAAIWAVGAGTVLLAAGAGVVVARRRGAAPVR